ncbi:MAG: hypothetical protein HZA91_13145, partial [Verrucomicrobia bacterium]|nr:hypothetical protein [Verrucomicrobiota bacterium]
AARADGVVVSVPAQAPDPNASVVVLQVKGEVPAQPYVVAPTKEGALALTAATATLNGSTLRAEPSGPTGNIGFWNKPDETIQWLAKVPADGKYAIRFEAASQKDSKLALTAGDKSVALAVAPATGDLRKYNKYKAGEIELKAGRQVKFVLAPVKEGWQPVNFHELRLEPVK